MSDSRLRRLRDSHGGPATLISEGCKIKGIVSGEGDFMISGEVEGECDLRGTVTLTRSGVWKGTLKAAAVVIAGRVVGDVISGGRIEISSTANISGTVTGEAIAVAEGAVVEGSMKTNSAESPTGFSRETQQRLIGNIGNSVVRIGQYNAVGRGNRSRQEWLIPRFPPLRAPFSTSLQRRRGGRLAAIPTEAELPVTRPAGDR
ncbi:MAG: polymer-forming cytoskeletal protein [Woeseiaceae bacterium]|nr:polymer-forming cytoskeletal protein [Woeseiaceae bacterium]